MTKRLMPIEKLLHWAYGAECVHRSPDIGGPAQARSALGAIDGARSGFSGVVGRAHNDALTLDRMVSEMATGALLRRHAVAGTRPDWRHSARHRMEPKEWVNGRSVRWGMTLRTVRFADYGSRRLGMLVNEMTTLRADEWFYYTPIVEVDAPHEVDGVRAIYSDWRAGLWALQAVLIEHGDSLTTCAVSDELPPERPWEFTQTPRILRAAKRTLTCE